MLQMFGSATDLMILSLGGEVLKLVVQHWVDRCEQIDL